jgi:DNA-binding response OmpR family regulator
MKSAPLVTRTIFHYLVEDRMAEKRIIVVDDDESIRKTFFLILRKNYKVLVARDAREALSCFKKTKVDLVIADVKLPGKNGLEMVAELRKSGYRGNVIMISAFPDLMDLNKLEQLSIGHFFVKPLDLKALNHSIDCLLSPEKDKSKRV